MNNMKNLKLIYDEEGEWTILLLNDKKIVEGHSISAKQALEALLAKGIIDCLIIEEI